MQPPNKAERAASFSTTHPTYSDREGHLFGIHQIRRTIRQSELKWPMMESLEKLWGCS